MSVAGAGVRYLESTLEGRVRLTDGTQVVFVVPPVVFCTEAEQHKAHYHLAKANVKRCPGRSPK